jgi:iron complex transport system ATP-binding protein
LTAHDRAVVQWAIRAAGAEHLAEREIDQLSDGERQRVMIARALAQEPDILLLDEPTAFLDLPGRVELMGLLLRLAREHHLAVVFSTHDLELALRAADTLWVLMNGTLHADGPEDLIFSGQLASVFASENIRFDPEQRTFRLLRNARGRAEVQGEGLAAILAIATLEREGFLCGDSSAGPRLLVQLGAQTEWRATYQQHEAAGKSFRELAEFTRSLKGI